VFGPDNIRRPTTKLSSGISPMGFVVLPRVVLKLFQHLVKHYSVHSVSFRHTLTLKMATVMFAETLEQLQSPRGQVVH
jgi:hypothetical protein